MKKSNDVSKSSHVSFKKGAQRNNTRSSGFVKSGGSMKNMEEMELEDEDVEVIEDGE